MRAFVRSHRIDQAFNACFGTVSYYKARALDIKRLLSTVLNGARKDQPTSLSAGWAHAGGANCETLYVEMLLQCQPLASLASLSTTPSVSSFG
jgi:hypothetical protein